MKNTLPALCACVQIVVLDFGINIFSSVVPLVIGKVLRYETVWLFTTAESRIKSQNFYSYMIMCDEVVSMINVGMYVSYIHL